MGQKTHPVGFRLGVIKTWDSNWYDEKGFAAKLNEDVMIRSYVRNRLKKAGISTDSNRADPEERTHYYSYITPGHCDRQKWKRNLTA